MQGPAPAPPAQMIRSSLTASVRFILSKQVLLGTIGTKVSCSLSVEVSVTPVAPQPEQDKSLQILLNIGLLTVDKSFLIDKSLSNARKTDRAEDV